MKTAKTCMIYKPSNLNELIFCSKKRKNETEEVIVDEIIELSEEAYQRLSDSLLIGSFDFLNGKGGMTEDDKHIVIEIKCKGHQTLLIDPEGYDYARYVGIKI